MFEDKNLGISMINGDEVKGFWNRILYFPQCLLAGLKGNSKSAIINKIALVTPKDEALVGSPPRRLSNMFWASIDWQALSRQLGRPASLDIGCGNGDYGHRFKRLLEGNFLSYTGIDLYKDEKFPEDFNHICVRAEDAYDYIEDCNVVVSQSALEHIEFDVAVLDSVTEKLVKVKKPFIQLHLIPASLSLYLYLWHGWRQYSKKNLGSIADILVTNHGVNVRIIPLGGWRFFLSLALYNRSLTYVPVLWHGTKSELEHPW